MGRFHLLHCTDDTINLSLNSDDAYKLMFLDQVKFFLNELCSMYFILFICRLESDKKRLKF